VVCMATEEGMERETESARTARLDRLADEDMPMLHTSNEVPKHEDHRNLGEGEDIGMDTMGMSMEGTGARARAELANDVQTATAETEGMYDAEIRAAHAFASFDDEMDKLSSATDDLKQHVRLAKAGTDFNTTPAAKTNDEDDEDLGEEDKSVLDEDKSDLLGDVNVKTHVDDTPNTDEKADALLADMGAKQAKKEATKDKKSNDTDDEEKDVGESDDDNDDENDEEHDNEKDSQENNDDDDETEAGDEVSMLDDAESFIQTKKGDDELAKQDLSKDENDLMGRAKLEASQWEHMDGYSLNDKMKRVEDLANAEDDAKKASESLGDVDEVEVNEGTPVNAEAMKVVENDEKDIGDALESAESDKVKSYVTQEAAREKKEIAVEEQNERHMEDAAKKKMLADIASMNHQ